MSAILKFDFQKREQLRFSEVNYLNYTKRPNFACGNYIFPKRRGNKNKPWTHSTPLKAYTRIKWGKLSSSWFRTCMLLVALLPWPVIFLTTAAESGERHHGMHVWHQLKIPLLKSVSFPIKFQLWYQSSIIANELLYIGASYSASWYTAGT